MHSGHFQECYYSMAGGIGYKINFIIILLTKKIWSDIIIYKYYLERLIRKLKAKEVRLELTSLAFSFFVSLSESFSLMSERLQL